MKKIVVAVVAMLAIGTSSFAQGFGWGVKAGLNVSGMNNTGLDSKTGLTAGVFVDYRFNDWIGMSADLLFSREGAMLKSGGDKYIAKTNYLNLPILAKFYVLDQLAFNIGIQPGVLLSGKDKVKESGEETAFTTTNNYKSFDFAFPVGVSYEFFNKLILDARYNIGVANISAGEGGKVHNNVFALTLGYRFSPDVSGSGSERMKIKTHLPSRKMGFCCFLKVIWIFSRRFRGC